jgi:hypothetical protein
MNGEKPQNGNGLIRLGDYELVGKNRNGELVELVFKPMRFSASALEALRFDHGERSAVVIKDRKLAKTLHDDEQFEILLRRLPECGPTPK